MFTRRNWLLRCSIIANLAVLLYMGVHIAVKSSPDYSFDPANNGRNLASAIENNPSDPSMIRNERLVSEAKQFGVLIPNSDKTVQDDVRLFALDRSSSIKSEIEQKITQVEADMSKLEENAVLAAEGDKIEEPANGGISNASDTGAIPNEAVIEEQNLIVTEEVPPELPRDETVLDGATLAKLRDILKCKDKPFEQSTRQRGEFWVLYNFVMADHGEMGCEESLTYTTHGDFTFMDNLVPLLERWAAPVSLAIHAPGSDLALTVDTIRYLRDCSSGAELVRKWTSFHVFFSAKHIPKQIPNMKKLLNEAYNCSLSVPYIVNSSTLYKAQRKLLYPVNVGRNVARDAALSHFVLASDIELYPSPGLTGRFLNMVARGPPALRSKSPRVFPITIFEVDSQQQVPQNKTHLVAMLKKGTAIPFHKKVCAGCHNVPRSKEWILANETQLLDVFHTGKRVGPFIHWEPIFIGTHADPLYDERLSWEGKSDKMTQAYAMCVLDYDFMILNNAFLVHRPGIKTLTKDVKRAQLAGKTNQLIRRIIFPELKVLYGTKKGCAV